MTNGLVNWVLLSLAKWLRVSPGLAQVALLAVMTLVASAQKNPPIHFTDPIELTYWTSVCAAVVLATWLTQGKYRKIWWRARPWRTAESLSKWASAADVTKAVHSRELKRPSALISAMTRVDSKLAGAVMAAVVSIGSYQIVADIEQAGFRTQWILALIYEVGGNLLLSSIVGGLFGLIAWAAWPEKSTPC